MSRAEANRKYVFAKLGNETIDGRCLDEASRVALVNGEIFVHNRDEVFVWQATTGVWHPTK